MKNEKTAPETLLKKMLPVTWHPFFSRYGRLTAIQKKTIPEILAGRSLVVCSPASTGKTEAIVAPLAERLIKERWEGLSVIYLCPTRALVNDLAGRIEEPLRHVEIEVLKKTGDHPSLSLTDCSSFLVTTPESFDSLISRKPAICTHLKAVVLDEIHLLDGTARGDQLRVLLERLRLLVKTPISFYALSATICDPAGLGKRYIEEFDVLRIETPREITRELLEYDRIGIFEDLITRFRTMNLKKILIFCNTRAQAEEFSTGFRSPPFLDRVFVHHGSLSKSEREDTEYAFHNAKVGVCVATSTLELGIDIGNIDAVVLFHPPPDPSSLYQRLGRGRRRRMDHLAAFGVYFDQWEKMFFESLFDCIERGDIPLPFYSPHISVCVQQIFSYCLQKKRIGVTFPSFQKILKPLTDDEELLRQILYHLEDSGHLIRERGVYRCGEKLSFALDRGLIHSNIDRGSQRYEVVEESTGKKIGEIESPAPVFHLLGRTWEMTGRKENKIFARTARRLGSGTIFKGIAGGQWDFRIGRKILGNLLPGMKEHEIPFFRLGESLVLIHLLGPLYGYLWSRLLEERKIDARDIEGKILVTEEGFAPGLLEVNEIPDAIKNHRKVINMYVSCGAFKGYLPQRAKELALIQRLDIERFREILNIAALVEIPREQGIEAANRVVQRFMEMVTM